MLPSVIQLIFNLVRHDLGVVGQVLSIVGAHQRDQRLDEIRNLRGQVLADRLSRIGSGQHQDQLNIVILRPDTQIRRAIRSAGSVADVHDNPKSVVSTGLQRTPELLEVGAGAEVLVISRLTGKLRTVHPGRIQAHVYAVDR
jgi:hypothetical protein